MTGVGARYRASTLEVNFAVATLPATIAFAAWPALLADIAIASVGVGVLATYAWLTLILGGQLTVLAGWLLARPRLLGYGLLPIAVALYFYAFALCAERPLRSLFLIGLVLAAGVTFTLRAPRILRSAVA